MIPEAQVSISGLTIQDGTGGEGGGIYNAGVLTVSNSTFAGNMGGAIYNTGSLIVSASTFASNTGPNFSGQEIDGTYYNEPFGSGIDNFNGGMATVSGSTFYDNTGSCIFNHYDSSVDSTITTVRVSGSTFSGNQAVDGTGIDNWGAYYRSTPAPFPTTPPLA